MIIKKLKEVFIYSQETDKERNARKGKAEETPKTANQENGLQNPLYRISK